jgi:hypothetical protein
MGPKPGPRYSIDRKDNNLGYAPSNCMWATNVQQARNTRATKYVQYLGRQMSVAEASELSGIPRSALYSRSRAGWPAQDMFLPVKGSPDPKGCKPGTNAV